MAIRGLWDAWSWQRRRCMVKFEYNILDEKGMKGMENKIILYHGSKEIVELPEIKIQRYNKDFYFGFLLHYV